MNRDFKVAITYRNINRADGGLMTAVIVAVNGHLVAEAMLDIRCEEMLSDIVAMVLTKELS